MPAPRGLPRLRVRQARHLLDSDVTVWRHGQVGERLVYVLRQNRPRRYETGSSRIIYIGTTGKGIDRVLGSLAFRTREVAGEWGVTDIDVKLVASTPRQRVKSWHKLERAFLLKFVDLYGETPLCNSTGHKMRRTDEFRYFAENTIEARLRQLER